MASGIYKLTFRDGSYYIGKSNDIAKRWDQHAKGMLEGKHTKKMQHAYNMYGEPEYSVLMECHPHHTDILEEYFIVTMWSPHILNTTKPNSFHPDEYDFIGTISPEVWGTSTFDHLLTLIKYQKKEAEAYDRIESLVEELESAYEEYDENIRELKSGTVLEMTERQLEYAKKDIAEYKKKLEKLQNRGLLARIFNWET